MPTLIALFRTPPSGKRQELNSDMLAVPFPCLFKALITYCFNIPEALLITAQAIGWLP